MIRLNFLELLRPLLSECKQTKLSVRCTILWQTCCWCSILQRRAVRMARISYALMCSLPWFHFHPLTTRQRQQRAGTVARSRWNLLCCDVDAFSMISSPLMDTKFEILKARSCSPSPVLVRPTLRGRRKRRPWTVGVFPGVSSSMMSCGDLWEVKPRGAKRLLSKVQTTGTLHVFPSKVRRTSLYASPLRSPLGLQLLV